MDKEKKEIKEESNACESKLPAQTSSTPPTTTSKTNKNLLNTTDDDTSTESSDTFESWTILNDKEKTKSEDILNDSTYRIEVLRNSDQEEELAEGNEENKKQTSFEETEKQDSFNDDLSDGISIISESESMGRISPHPYIREHLHDFKLKFCLSDHMDDTILNRMREEMDNETVPLIVQDTTATDGQHLRQRRKSSSSTLEANNQALQKASQTSIAPVDNSILTPLMRTGLQSIFMFVVGLAILALIGKIVNPTWQPSATKSSFRNTAELEQKLNDMELQNNLMRAEIDLLNKQVKYLSTFNDAYQQKHQTKHKDYRDSKTFKAWSGNGDTLKPIDITKEDLRAAYKCPDGSFVEIANMCMEKRPKDEPSLVDQFGKVVEDLKEQSEVFKTFEKVAEEIQGFQDNPFEQLQTEQAETQHEFIKNKPIYQPSEDLNQKLFQKDKYQKQRPKGENYHSASPYKHYNKQAKYEDASKSNKEYKNSFGKEFTKDSKEFKTPNNSKERGEWKTDKFNNNNSKERKYRKDNSKERFNKQFNDIDEDSQENSKENNSKERYNNNNNYKAKRKYNKNGSNEDLSGEWQTNYMKHRENQRKSNEQKYQDNKNWYIKRGDGREYKRSGEKQFR